MRSMCDAHGRFEMPRYAACVQRACVLNRLVEVSIADEAHKNTNCCERSSFYSARSGAVGNGNKPRLGDGSFSVQWTPPKSCFVFRLPTRRCWTSSEEGAGERPPKQLLPRPGRRWVCRSSSTTASTLAACDRANSFDVLVARAAWDRDETVCDGDGELVASLVLNADLQGRGLPSQTLGEIVAALASPELSRARSWKWRANLPLDTIAQHLLNSEI